MRLVGAVLAAAVLVQPAVPAHADLQAQALNGRFTVISDGLFAKTNDRRHNELTVTSTWTIATSCTSALDCAGQMGSDQGWSAPVTYIKPLWYVTRVVSNWIPCPDGTFVDGQQTFKFFVDEFDRPFLRGWDNTLGPSGACGVNKVLNIEMPLKLTPIG
jgi:hypothetical protein